jgi:hypothetical protein
LDLLFATSLSFQSTGFVTNVTIAPEQELSDRRRGLLLDTLVTRGLRVLMNLNVTSSAVGDDAPGIDCQYL